MQKHGFFDSMSSVGIILILLIALNVISGKAYFKVDITEDRLYSLSEGTKAILKRLSNDVHVKFYFTESLESVPLQLKAYGVRVRELLQEYRDYSSGRVRLETFDPKPDTEDEEWATKYSLQGVPLPSGENFYMGAVFLSPNGEKSIAIFNPQRENFLEYDISQMISQSMSAGKKKLGVLSSQEVVGLNLPFQMPGAPANTEDWAFVRELKKTYEVIKVDKSASEIPAVDVLLVHHPKDLSEAAQYAIDQFVVNGGRAMFLVDPSSTVEENAQGPKSSDLGKLFSKWGVQFNAANLVADLENATQVSSQEGVIEYPVWLSLKGNNVNKENVAVMELETLLFVESGSVGLSTSASGIEFTSTVFTSTSAGEVPAFLASQGNPMEVMKTVAGSGGKVLALAGIFSGTFASAFDKKPEAPKPAEGEKEQPGYSKEHLAQAKGKGTIVVVGDSDFVADRYCVRTMNFFGQKLSTLMNDNLSFVLNSLEFLLGDQDLISIRSRGKSVRPFLVVQALQKQAAMEWKTTEERLSMKLQEVQEKINQLQNHKVEGGKVVLSKEQIRQIEELREAERAVKKERREVRKNLREDIESLGQRLTFLNIFFVPLLLGLYGTWRVMNYSRRGGN